MGKPFAKELERLSETLEWSLGQDTEELRQALLHQKKPLVIVGSGGSLSACHFAALLYQQFGMMAKTVTPLELYYAQNILRESYVLFISASGRNNDILFAYKTAISCESQRLFSICMKAGSPLEELAATVSTSTHFSYDLPVGGDGFLATNSLMAFFGLLQKALHTNPPTDYKTIFDSKFETTLNTFFTRVNRSFTFSVIYAGWGQPVAADIESKLAEAALGNILLSDYRNFGHGRHHWFDKRAEDSCIIALVTPEEKEIAAKTLSLIPDSVPVLWIETTLNGPIGAIELLVKSFYFVLALGRSQGIDPGRPGVPEFGSRLYHLNYRQIYRSRLKRTDSGKQLAIIRKANVPLFSRLTADEQKYWLGAYDSYVTRLGKARFGSVVFDYDGTICSQKNRYTAMDAEVVPYLTHILQEGFVVGIATGRGDSVRTALRESIPEIYWSRVIVGYYNCSEISLLNNDSVPDESLGINEKLTHLHDKLKSFEFPVKIDFRIKPHQLTVRIEDPEIWQNVRAAIIQIIMLENLPGIQILESSHSMDIIDQSVTNKLNIKVHCERLTDELGMAADCLFIGDKGMWPGNDYQLLSEPYTLSVDEVSPLYNNCWNLAGPGIKNVMATIYYLSCLQFKPGHLALKIK